MLALFFLAALLATPTRSSSPSSNAAGLQPTATFCSGHSPAVTSSEVTRFLAAVCAGAYGVAHMSHNMSSYVVTKNRTMYGVAQCRPDVSVPDCTACLAASSKLISGTACAASAVWHDACFLRYSDHDDPGRFREDEYTATVFNASRALSPHVAAKALVRRLLDAAGKSTTSSHMCRSVGAATGTAAGGLVYGLTRCAAGISCADCRRCLRGALQVVDREYNGSAGMQVLRLSCMARYESYPFYNTESLARRLLADARSGSGLDTIGAPPGPAPPPPPAPAPRYFSINASVGGLTVNGRRAAHPTPAPPPADALGATRPAATPAVPAPPGGRTPLPAAASPNGKNSWFLLQRATVHPCFSTVLPTVCVTIQ